MPTNDDPFLSHFSRSQRAMLVSSFKTPHYRKSPSLYPGRQWEAGSSSLKLFSCCRVTLGQEQPPNHPHYTTEKGRCSPKMASHLGTVDSQLKVALNSSPFNQKALLLTHFCWGGGAFLLLCQECPGILGLKRVATMKTCLTTTCDIYFVTGTSQTMFPSGY